MQDLFDVMQAEPEREEIAPGAWLLRRRALPVERDLLDGIAHVSANAPFRNMVTPGGFTMSVAMTSCGEAGWVTDRRGYRYQASDPATGTPWPAMLGTFRDLATVCAEEAGFPGFFPDACLINRYDPGARMSLHQDKDEADFAQPIVSVSLGLTATFQFGGLARSDKTRRIALRHGDVIVWGGPSRLVYHGILPLKDGTHPLTGGHRFNLTFRRAFRSGSLSG